MSLAGPIAYRSGRAADLDACIGIWRLATEDYLLRLNQAPRQTDTAPLRRHLVHLLAEDPARFWVAVDAGGDGGSGEGAEPDTGAERVGGAVVGFSAASVRDGLWYLAMLFVLPRHQGRGVGRALLDRAQAGLEPAPGRARIPGPDQPLDSGIHTWGMATDAVQPISNALYASRGMMPRLPVWRLTGEPYRSSALPAPPPSLEVVSFEAIAANGHDGSSQLAAVVDELDREVLGITRPADHEFLRREGRIGFLLRERDGRAHGYAYASGNGRVGPVLARDPALQPALLGAAVRGAPVLGPLAAWIPGTADTAIRCLLDAGLRIDGFPALLCWSRREHPFERYLAASLAMV